MPAEAPPAPPPPLAPRRPDAAFRARAAQVRPRPPDTTTAPETTRIREVTTETQRAEITQVAKVALHKKISEIQTNGGPQNENEEALWGAKRLGEDYKPAEGQTEIIYEKTQMLGGSLPEVTVDGNTFTILGIQGATADDLICFIQQGTSAQNGAKNFDIRVPRELAVEAQLRSERERIKTLFSGEQQTVVDMYARATGGEDVLSGTEPRQINEAIAKAATASGMLTAGDGEALINATLPALKAEDGERPEDIRQREQARNALFDRLKGQNLLDADTLIETVKATGISQTTIAQEATRSVTEIQRLQQELLEDPNNKDLQKKLRTAGDVAKVWKKLQEADIEGENSPIRQFFDRVQQGNMKPEDLQAAVAAIKEGRLGEFVGNAIMGIVDDKTLTEAERRERAERRQAAMAALGKSGMGVSLLLMLLEWAIGDIGGIKQQ